MPAEGCAFGRNWIQAFKATYYSSWLFSGLKNNNIREHERCCFSLALNESQFTEEISQIKLNMSLPYK
jgi:hypothetical protein